MRHLPDKPSLHFLRSEAKALLATLRESNPEASLADAQQALASEYGVRNWPELKSEVERRVAEVPTAPDGLVETLVNIYSLGNLTEPPSPVSYQSMGRNWSIVTDRGRWIQVGPSPMVPTRSTVARKVGSILGTLHALAIPSQSPIGSYLTTRRPRSAWTALVDEARAAGKPWAAELDDALPVLFDLNAIDLEVDDSELILCNRVLIPENLRIGRHDNLVVTEWDLTGSLTPELELAWVLTHWAPDPESNHQAIAAIRDGYADTTGRSPRLELASFAIAVTSYLNWTYQSVCASMNSTDADHVDFAERETVDVLKRPMSRTTLEQLLAVINE